MQKTTRQNSCTGIDL